jgi:hypothetical protein
MKMLFGADKKDTESLLTLNSILLLSMFFKFSNLFEETAIRLKKVFG